jgi:hypothetical protein
MNESTNPPPAAPSTAPSPQPPAGAIAPPAVEPRGGPLPARAWLGGLDPATRRPTFIVAAILAGFFFGSQILNEALPARAEDQVLPGNPVAIGENATIVPLAGWVLSRFDDSAGLRLEKGTVAVDLFPGTSPNAGDLLETYFQQVLGEQATEITTSETETASSATGTAARFNYQGLFAGADGAIEGEVTAIAAAGQGVIADAWAPQGRLESLLDEVHVMVDTIEVRP